MGILSKLFGRKGPAAGPAPEPQEDSKPIRVFDEFGREAFISKDTWRRDVLPGTIRSHWDDPDGLYQVIVSSLQDGFATDVDEAARRLQSIDPDPERAACVRGIVLLQQKRLDESEKVLRDYIERHGERGIILTNLAKVYAEREDHAKADQTLWHALEVDPNQDNALGWYSALQRERGGEEASLAGWRRIAAMPGSWRAQLWLARAALAAGKADEALSLYHQSLSRSGRPVPQDLLMQMTGDLGSAGRVAELIALAEPLFDAQAHGLVGGNNLIRAHVELGQLEAARSILKQLYAQKRPDWVENLRFWDAEIAKAEVEHKAALKPGGFTVTLLDVDAPIWLTASSRAAGVLPAKASDAPMITFLAASATVPAAGEEMRAHLTDDPGRMSRALPLFLAEQTHLATGARARTLIPWVVEPPSGFMVSGAPLTAAEAVVYARKAEQPGTWVVSAHLHAATDPWRVELCLIRIADGERVETLEVSFPKAEPQTALPELARRLASRVAVWGKVETVRVEKRFEAPADSWFASYLVRLEQLLATRCAGREGTGAGFLHGEREILDGNLQLCLEHPRSVATRLILLATVAAMKKVRPEVIAELDAKLALLAERHPLPDLV